MRDSLVGKPAGRVLLEFVGLDVVAVTPVSDGKSLGLEFGEGRTVTLIEEGAFDYLSVSDPEGVAVY